MDAYYLREDPSFEFAFGFRKVKTEFSRVRVEVKWPLVFSQIDYTISRLGGESISIRTVDHCSYSTVGGLTRSIEGA